MDNTKYIGMEVHSETISIAVLNSAGKLLMESVIETKAITIVEFFQGLRGDLHVTLEEGTWAAWLYDLLKPHVTEVLVCDPRKNALLNDGNKSDRIDARKLAELLSSNLLRPVYHGEHVVRTLKELSRRYLAIGGDLVRVLTRLKALYRSWAKKDQEPQMPKSFRPGRFCTLANPRPNTLRNRRTEIRSFEIRHVLEFGKTRSGDFGEFLCHSIRLLGRISKRLYFSKRFIVPRLKQPEPGVPLLAMPSREVSK